MAAKLSGEVHKPNQQTTMLPAYVPDFLAALRVRKIPGCGYSSARKLQAEGVEYVSQLRALSQKKLISLLGELIGSRLYLLCRGEDNSIVKPRGKEKTMSEEDSFLGSDNVVDVELRISQLLKGLLERTDARFERHGDLPSLLRLTVRDRVAAKKKGEQKNGYFGGRSSKQTAIPMGVFHPGDPKRDEKLISALMQLFFKLVPRNLCFHLTLLNVAVARFQPFGGASGNQTGIDSFFHTAANTSSRNNEKPLISSKRDRLESHNFFSVKMKVAKAEVASHPSLPRNKSEATHTNNYEPTKKRNRNKDRVAEGPAGSPGIIVTTDDAKVARPSSAVTAEDIDDLFNL
eukprot:CAMPEP_0170195810 /NCGR_PEP_ID=MMETSP0040_2-20121228/62261_1 /TAXON_ID=641309 /ORGANISM="Lotharella oceanica, Strain CCMP622" /LENGTH=345 /DNA_ID=CAMNT_0010445063 /DNA_START=444 /DNA_END=1481 /DNA_ORIENTATION=+